MSRSSRYACLSSVAWACAPSSPSTSSRIAAAIRGFGAFGHGPLAGAARRARPRSRPRRSRCRVRPTSLKTTRSAFFVSSIARLRSRPSSPSSAPKATSSWPGPLALAEQAGRCRPSARARPSRLRRPSAACVASALRRPVVGDGGGEQRDVDVGERERGVEHRLGGRRRDRLDAEGRRGRRGSRRAGSTSAPRRRASSASATPIRPDERLPTKRTLSSGSRVPPAVTSTRRPARQPGASSCSTRAAISSGSAIRPTPHSPSAISPSSGPTSSTPRATSVSAFARVAGCAHMRGFIAGATSTGPRWASAASVSRLSEMPCASFASVFAVQGATTSRSARVRCG